LQSKKGKREEAKKKAAGAGIARYGRREVWTPLSPLPPTSCDKKANVKNLDVSIVQKWKFGFGVGYLTEVSDILWRWI